jgi:hypothetical protein
VAASFEVVLADLQSMAGTFHTEAAGYRALVTVITPTAVDSGDGGLNSVMASVFTSLSSLHELMAESIAQHGDQLGKARDAYAAQEIDNRFLFDDLNRESW